ALAGATADAYAIDREDLLAKTAFELKTTAEDVPARVAGLLEERKKLERELTDLRRKLATGGGGASSDDRAGGDVTEIGGIKYAPRQLEGMPAKELKSMADEIKKQIGSGVTAIVSVDDGKASIVVGVTADVMEKISAVDLVRVGSAALGGKGGGGRPDMAQAGGPDGSAAQAALDAIAAAIGDATA
ncbi:unnamed protein product, partial [Laminaria digitata]